MGRSSNDRPGNPPGISILTVAPDEVGQILFWQVIDQIGCAGGVIRIEAHVERAVCLEGETPVRVCPPASTTRRDPGRSPGHRPSQCRQFVRPEWYTMPCAGSPGRQNQPGVHGPGKALVDPGRGPAGGRLGRPGLEDSPGMLHGLPQYIPIPPKVQANPHLFYPTTPLN